MSEPNFEGLAGSTCEHRTVGPHRAWCHDCHEWCYPNDPCVICKATVWPETRLSALLWEARELIDMFGDVVQACTGKDDGQARRVRDEIDAYRRFNGWPESGP